MAKDFRALLKSEYIVLDGAMGTMLQAAGMKYRKSTIIDIYT